MPNYKYELQWRDCKNTFSNVREEVRGNVSAANVQAMKVNNGMIMS